jgi:type I restriction enzyme S subunit
MKDNHTALPKLRFPQFKSPWELKKIAPYLQECSSRVSVPTSLPIYTSSRVGLKPQEDYYGGRTIINDGEYGVVPPECFVFRHMSDDGQFAFHTNETGGDIAVSKEYPVFRAIGLDRHFLLAKLNHSPDFKAFALAQKAGGTRTRLYLSKLRTWETLLPSYAEQRKIAEFLTSLDEWIAAERQKLEALRAHKKGLMQELFPHVGETLPNLRFPEFQNAGDWVCGELFRCLKKVIDYRGKAPPKSDSGVPLITAKNVRFGWLDMTNDEYIEEDKYKDWMSKGTPQVGDILFTTEAPLGNVARFPSTGKFALGQRIITLRSRPESCLPEFLFQSLLGPRMQKEIDLHSTGSTAKGIKSAVFTNISFCYPGIEEQRRIADCLSPLDALIAAQSRKVDSLRAHRKGLMQQLFPRQEGV